MKKGNQKRTVTGLQNSAGLFSGLKRNNGKTVKPFLKESIEKEQTKKQTRFKRNNLEANNVDKKSIKKVSGLYVSFVCFLIIGCASLFIYHLSVRFEGVSYGYQANRLRDLQNELMLEQKKLKLELASLKEQSRIENEVRIKLGMENPSIEKVIYVNKRRKVINVSGKVR